MAQTTWILVANASLARFYANSGPNKGLALMKEIRHPESSTEECRPGHRSAGQHGRYRRQGGYVATYASEGA